MKHLIASATILTLMAGSAFAQQGATPPPPPPPAAAAPMQPQNPPPPELAPGNAGNPEAGNQYPDAASGPQDEMAPDQNEPGDAREARRGPGRHWDHDGPRGHHWRKNDRGPRHGRDDEGARFRLTTQADGEVELDVRCAANEPMQACADIVNGLLDRLSNDEATSDRDL